MTSKFPVVALAIAVPLFVFASLFKGDTLTAPFEDVGEGNFLGDIVEVITGIAAVIFSLVIFNTGFHLPWLVHYGFAVFIGGNMIWSLVEALGWQGALIATVAELVALIVGLIPGV